MRYLRLVAYPTAVPRAMGSKMEAAGLAKTAAGSVREGMKVVIFAVLWVVVKRKFKWLWWLKDRLELTHC